MSFGEVLGTGLVAGIVVQLMQFLRELYQDRKERRRSAARQAFILSNKLKVFSYECEERIVLYKSEEIPPEEEAPAPPEIPDFPFLELAEDLPELSMADLSRIADLQMQKELENNYVRFRWSMEMDVVDVGRLQVKRLEYLAKESADIAKVVREKYFLPDFGDHMKLIRNE